MSRSHPPTPVLVVTYNSTPYLPGFFQALAQNTEPGAVEIWLADNASVDGSAACAEREAARWGQRLTVVRLSQNLGFTGGNNALVARLREDPRWSALVLLNPDTEVQPGWLGPLLEALTQPGVGSVASVLLLPDRTLNSRGNRLHYLGFGYVDGLGEAAASAQSGEIFFASGAAVAVSREALRTVSSSDSALFWDELGLYGEDVDLGWRLRLQGWSNRVAVKSQVVHHYTFFPERADPTRLTRADRNRWLVLLANYHWATLILLLPGLGAVELLVALGWRQRVLGPRRAVWSSVIRALTPEFWQHRQHVQRTRRRGDRVLMHAMDGRLSHGALNPGPVLELANTLAETYLRWLRGLIWW